ncbi:sensor domain-containing diguanylate cyclase [Sphingomonas edaphi]|nr:GGDEF domain-containing protein [Sphingomonas edaphi]
MLIGAGLSLLLISALANFLIGIAVRRAEPLWNAAWAVGVLGWAALWTQVALFIAPQIAGTMAARAATLCSTAAIACAGGYMYAVSGRFLPRWGQRALAANAILVMAVGGFAAIVPAAMLLAAATALNIVVAVAAFSLVWACLCAWRRGSSAARDFALSFSIPTAAVLWSTYTDSGLNPGDESGLYLVLVACSLQIFGLTIGTSLRMWAIRHERDAALRIGTQLAALAETDPLTGLLNRRGFIGRADGILLTANQAALVVLDLDGFKGINDRSGHHAGDELLKAVADELSKAGLELDAVVGRLGGEEFGVLLGRCDKAKAEQAAEALRTAVAAAQTTSDGNVLKTTASAGLALGQTGDSFTMLYKAADRALYKAKRLGRDRTELAESRLSEAA